MTERKEVVRGLQDAIGLARERGSAVVHLRVEHAEAILDILKPPRETIKKLPCTCGRKALETWVGWVDGKVMESFKCPNCGRRTGMYKTHKALVEAWNRMVMDDA